MRKLSQEEKEAMRRKIEEYHEDKLMGVTRDADQQNSAVWSAIRTASPALNGRRLSFWFIELI